MVGINVPMAFHSFGGWKDSLFGDVHIHGPEGMRFYTWYKTVSQRWPEPRNQPRNSRCLRIHDTTLEQPEEGIAQYREQHG